MHRLVPLALLLLPLVVLALPVTALAEDSRDEEAEKKEPTRRIARRSYGDPGVARPSAIHPVQSLHAQTFPIRLLGLWAEGQGFALSRRAAVYDLEGGAALRLDEGVHFIASYRMLGIDLGFDSDVKGAPDGEPAIAAPFIGLAFDF